MDNISFVKLEDYLILCFYLKFNVEDINYSDNININDFINNLNSKFMENIDVNRYDKFTDDYDFIKDDDFNKYKLLNNEYNGIFNKYNILNYEPKEKFLEKYNKLINDIDNFELKCSKVIVEIYNECNNWIENIFDSTENEHKREKYIFNYDSEYIKLFEIRNRIFKKINNKSSFKYNGILEINNNVLKLSITY